MAQSERTKVYGEISRDSFNDVLEAMGGIENTPTEELLKVQGWLLRKPAITKGEAAQAKRIARSNFNRRRTLLLKELALLNFVLGIQKTPYPQQQEARGDGRSLEEKVAPIEEEKNTGAAPELNLGQVYLDPKEAKRRLFSFFQDILMSNVMYGVLKRDGIPFSLIERFTALTSGYAFIDINLISQELNVYNPKDVLRILSSFPGDEIKEIVKELNPQERYNKQIYIMQKNAPFPDVLTRLKRIRDSLNQPHFAYADLLEILKGKELHPNSSYFDIVVRTLFARRPEGTYDRDSVQKFNQESEKYKFAQLRKLLNYDLSRIPEFVEALEKYDGPLILKYPVSGDLIQSPNDPTHIYLFKEPIDIEILGSMIKFELPKPATWRNMQTVNQT